jgi:hypothetical protein
MILQNYYTYLRDATTKNFTDMKLLGALSFKWHSLAMVAAPAAHHKSLASAKAPPTPLLGHVRTVTLLWICMRVGQGDVQREVSLYLRRGVLR